MSKSSAALLVLGMHRSGTSALARLLNLAGAALPRAVMPPAKDNNEAGFWEPQRLVDFHEQILREAGLRWDDWRQLYGSPAVDWVQTRQELSRLLIEEYGDANLFILKDPRVCRLVPLYREACADLKISPIAFLSLRNPLGTMRSISKRDGLSARISGLSWLRHVLEAERDTRDMPRTFISYEALMSDWRSEMTRALQQVGLEHLEPSVETQVECDAFLSADLQHYRPSQEDLLNDAETLQWVKDAYLALLCLRQNPRDASAIRTLDRIYSRFSAAAAAFGDPLLEEFARRQHEAEIKAAEHSARLKSYEAEIRAARSRLAQQSQDAALQRQEIEKAQAALATAERRLAPFLLDVEAQHRQSRLGQRLIRKAKSAKRVLGVRLRPVVLSGFDKVDGQSAQQWISNKNDPSFLIWAPSSGALRRGHYWLHVELTVGAAGISAPCIYFDTGDGFSETECVPLSFERTHGNVYRAAFALPSPARALRFDPTAGTQPITVGRMWLRHLPSTLRYTGMLAKVATRWMQHPALLLHDVKLGAELVASGGPRALAAKLRSMSAAMAMAQQGGYQRWISEFDALTPTDRTLIREHIAAADLPQTTVTWAMAESDASFFDDCLASLSQQILVNWRATFFVATGDVELLKSLAARAASDTRVRVLDAKQEPQGTQPAPGPIALLSGAIRLHETALYQLALAASQGATLVYGDEDDVNSHGTRAVPFFKPGPSPALARQTNYFGRCLMLAGAGRPLMSLIDDFAQARTSINDLAAQLAATVPPQAMRHVPFVLFHNLSAAERAPSKPAAAPTVAAGAEPTVSVIIPTRDKLDLLQPCLESLFQNTDYPRERLEIIVVDNGSTEPQTLEYLSALSRDKSIVVRRDDRPFNYARLNNEAARASRGEILVLLNNDVVVRDRSWLRRLAAFAQREDVGAVGARLLYPDGTTQHGGVVLGIQGVAAHAHHGIDSDETGYHGLASYDHEISAVTGACLAIKKSLFEAIGGLDEKLAVAFNDTLLCMDVLERGLTNMYVGDALFYHHESKTRGFDDTPEKVALFQREASYARAKHPQMFRSDAFYSPCLSLERCYELAFPPRRAKPWESYRRDASRQLKVLLLSSTHEIGHGVPVVLKLQAEHLARQGHSVIVGGPQGQNEIAYDRCRREILNGSAEAARFIAQNSVDCAVIHTPPYFSVARWVGQNVKTVLFDHGEPDPEFFPDAEARRRVLQEKKFCAQMMDSLVAISDAIKAEADEPRMRVIANCNSHLAVWNDSMKQRREQIRTQHGWDGKIVVLSVCRFHSAERRYKGVDTFARLKALCAVSPAPVVFVQCGKASDSDIAELRSEGIEVFANVPDSVVLDLYCAADLYASFSRWEGYNLGIGQALAMGLPVVASDIPAHRAFGVFTSNNIETIHDHVLTMMDQIRQAPDSSRRAVVWPWEHSLAELSRHIEDLCLSSDQPATRKPAIKAASAVSGGQS